MGVLADEDGVESSSYDGKNPVNDENCPVKNDAICSNTNVPSFSVEHYDTNFARSGISMSYCSGEIPILPFPATSTATCSQYELRDVEEGVPNKDLNHTNYIRSRGCRKEKKRTECINTAFSELRRRIPNVPLDTKLSKIKTLRLATSYIAYLTDIVKNSDPSDVRDGRDFRADLKALRTRERRRDIQEKQGYVITQNKTAGNHGNDIINTAESSADSPTMRKKGRTGWPEAVWAMELENISSRTADQMGPSRSNGLNITRLHQHQIQNASTYTNASLHQTVYGADNNARAGNHHYIENGRNLACSFGSPLLAYNYKLEPTMIPTIRESNAYTVDSYQSYDDFAPCIPYTPIPLPAASSFSKRFSHVPAERNGISEYSENCQTAQIYQNLTQADPTGAEGGQKQMEYMEQTQNRIPEQTTLTDHPSISIYSPLMITDLTFSPANGEQQSLWEGNGQKLNVTEESKPANLAELKTVSPATAASIRISTSTMNGFATFTTSERSEFECLGATRVVESNNV